ncbi:MAG TPA: sulfotransferase domain-containing protein [Bdellovibrionales bacterium]|nr:sulfotransferase domain-containing protein [Bdellovibrionales bacterium]
MDKAAAPKYAVDVSLARLEESELLGSRDLYFLCSFPKCGRTYLRFILAHYFRLRFKLKTAVDFDSVFSFIPNYMGGLRRGVPALSFNGVTGLPAILCSHTIYSSEMYGTKPVLLLVRSPHDVMVSWFFHKTKHQREFKEGLGAFLRSPEFGIETYVRFLNAWAGALPSRRHHVASYELLLTSPSETVRDILGFMNVAVNGRLLDQSLSAASFAAMLEQEQKTPVPDEEYDVAIRDARRVRRGVIGGYRDVMEADDAAYVSRVCESGLSAGAKRLLNDAMVEW